MNRAASHQDQASRQATGPQALRCRTLHKTAGRHDRSGRQRLHTVQEIADTVGVHRTTVYEYLRRDQVADALDQNLSRVPADTRPMPDVTAYDQLLTRRPTSR